MRFIRPKMLMAASAFALVAAACGGATPEGEGGGGGGGGAEGDAPQIGVALDIGGLGDKSFNDAADRGLQQAIEDGLVPEENAELLESNATGSNRDENVVNLADQGFDLIWANGFAFSEGIAEIAPDYPDVNFAIQDGFATTIATDADNIVDINFKAHEGSFLVGAAAGLVTETKTVGFLGGQEGIGLIENFQAGWDAGVQATCPDCELLTEYIGDSTAAFVDPTRGEALSAAMYDDGADVIYHAAGQSGLGLFKAAVAADALAIGVDSDQYLTASPEEQEHILTSMLKRVDVAIYDTIEAVTNDAFEPGSQIFGLAEDGVGYATSNPELLTEEIQAQLEEFKQQIIDGEITVPEQPEGG
ncbi:MAG TPA: BMP family ABC transporter substrate-binding protein [Actinomycetota bacterium]|nr:BMP family ABC transporter substrate-binding protein [Actinomycetota bacterium]